MVEPDQAPGSADADDCQKVEDLLKQVTSEFNRYEAKKTPELKAELEAFVKKKATLDSDYKQKYPALREKWCLQHQQIEKLSAALKCAFPNWKELLGKCVCKPKHDIRCFEQRLNDRKWCCQGKLERARDAAKYHFEKAKSRLDALQANAQKASDELTALDKLIKDIQNAMPGPDQETVLYSFWFEALRRHKRLTPEDVDESCKKFGDDEKPEKICEDVWKEKCPEEDGACKKPDGEGAHPEEKSQRRDAPWLMKPPDYPHALDCAWDDYHKAKDAFAEKDAAFRASPDDLDSLGKQLDAQKKGLEDAIKACLKESRAADDCCKTPAPPAAS